jgi:hypothetical protein
MTNTQVSKPIKLTNKEISKLRLYTVDREGYYFCKSGDGFVHVIKNGIDLLEGKNATKVIWGGVDLEGVDLRLVCENYRNPANCIYKQKDGCYYTLENHIKLKTINASELKSVEIGSGFDYILPENTKNLTQEQKKKLKEIIKKRSFVNLKVTTAHQTLPQTKEHEKKEA